MSNKLIIHFSLIVFWTACVSPDNQRLEKSLQLSGDNRSELEQVLTHYADESEKQAAARFLIMNALGHAGVDSLIIERLQSMYDKHIAISQKYQWERSSEWKTEIDSLWQNEKMKVGTFLLNRRQDIKTLKADWLIREIDRSFKAWKENVYTRNDSFEDFCNYILPYRFAEGICLDGSRDTFYRRHAHLFHDPMMDFRAVTDSLHRVYSDLMHHNWAAYSMPVLSTTTLEQIKRGSCDDKAWYNCLMMSALGMGVAIDFVPEWGNRSGGHSWNSLVVGGETYPFEPFWDDERWKYKRIYNNKCFDLKWGKFRLPKVYRQTFAHNMIGPMIDSEINKADIPPLFRNPFIKDVSSQYFEAKDIQITLTESISEGMRYCYLCVFGAKGWKPVQWGRIEKNKTVTFREMGKDIVYFPMFYQQGTFIPASSAFLLTDEGEYEELKCGKDQMSVTVRNNTAYLYPEEIAEAKAMLVGSHLVGTNDQNTSMDTLCTMTDSMDVWGNEILLPNPQAYRYIQLMAPKDSIGLCEISFFEEGEDKPVQSVKVSAAITPLTDEDLLDRMVDNSSATAFKGLFTNKEKKILCFDFGKPISISRISYIPYTKNYLSKGSEIELCYWNNEWVSTGIRIGDGRNMTFDHIPKGAIYRVKVKGTNDRIFTYRDGIIHWY